MSENFKLVRINSDYCNYLRNYDNRVMYNYGEKELRPFIGVLFTVNDVKYFAPLSSPKPKHLKMKNAIDFYKIDSGRLGAINLNNMIPVTNEQITYIDLYKKYTDPKEQKYQKMLKTQLFWLNRRDNMLRERANQLYVKYMNGTLKTNIITRCCDFRLLEEKCIEYSRINLLFPKMQHITKIDDLYYIYDNLNNQDNFETVAQALDTPVRSATIQDMSEDEINDILIARRLDQNNYNINNIPFIDSTIDN